MVASQAGDVVCLHCDATHSGSANTSDAYRYFVTSYIGQPTRVLRQDWAEAEGPRDNLGCDAINALVQLVQRKQIEGQPEDSAPGGAGPAHILLATIEVLQVGCQLILGNIQGWNTPLESQDTEGRQ